MTVPSLNKRSVAVSVGGLVVGLQGTGELFEEISRETASFPIAPPECKADVVFQLCSEWADAVGPGGYDVQFKTARYTVLVRKGPPLHVSFFVTRPLVRQLASVFPTTVLGAVRGLTMRNCYSREEYYAASFMYDVFMVAMQHAMMQKGRSFMHASAVSGKNGEASVFCGASGSGKSATVQALLLEGGHRLLSDDMLIVSDAGVAYLNAMHAVIKTHTLSSTERLEEHVLSSMASGERALWQFLRPYYGAVKLVKRVPILQLHPDSIALEAPIGCCFFLLPTEERGMHVRELTVDEFVSRASVYAVGKEAKMVGHLAAIAGDGTPARINNAIDSLCRKALARARCYEICIPWGTPSSAVVGSVYEVVSEAEGAPRCLAVERCF